MKKFIFLVFIVLIFTIPSSGRGQDVASSLKDIAFERAKFGADDYPPVPEARLNFFSPPLINDPLNHTQKVVNMFSGYVPLSLQFIYRAPKYTVYDGNTPIEIYSFKRGVNEILADGGVELAIEDVVDPPRGALMSSPVNAGKTIKITRVVEAEIEKFEPLPYQTKEIDDNTLECGLRKTTQEGKVGQRRLLYLVHRENGAETSRKLIKDEITQKPQDKIIKVGTKVVVLSSVSGTATATNLANAVVSANYKKGTLIRITNRTNGVAIIKTVNYTWGLARPPEGIVLDLSWSILGELKYSGSGAGPSVLVEELKQ